MGMKQREEWGEGREGGEKRERQKRDLAVYISTHLRNPH